MVVVTFFKSLDEQKNFVHNLITKIVGMMEDKTFHLYASHDLEDQEKFYSLFKFENVMIESIKPGIELELKDYIKEMKNETFQKNIVQEILQDKSFWNNK